MKVALATAWRPRGESRRFEKLLPRLKQVYSWIAVSLPPDVDDQILEFTSTIPEIKTTVTKDWGEGRHASLAAALDGAVDTIHYVDFDRLLRWVETRPEEWKVAVQALEGLDCVIFGRTEAAYSTHPQALVKTEAISNRVVSHLLGMLVDASAGSKGFSRGAVEFLLAHSRQGRALGMDGEWPVLLHRAGYRVDYMEVDGLDWESADRYQDVPASPERQSRTAAEYDRDASNWRHRAAVAEEIVAAGLEASLRKIGK
jgi:hypothetical protein